LPIATHGKTIRLHDYRKPAKFRVASRTGYRQGIGMVEAASSKRLSDGSFVVHVADETDLPARYVGSRYRGRWPIEVTLEILKQYQTTRYENLIDPWVSSTQQKSYQRLGIENRKHSFSTGPPPTDRRFGANEVPR
jgi:hypothetical protein